MPPKLQVDESFAFLFTCIEASGCKIDFKLVGDATDLQPAAARMRYTRLRKAVEAGEFRGATLSQPVAAVVSTRMSQMANPQSKRLGEYANTTIDLQQQDAAIPQRNDRKSRSRNRSVISIDNNEEEQEEPEHKPHDQSDFAVDQSRKKRDHNTVRAESEDGLFFPDTSQTTRDNKRIKRSDSVVEADRPPAHFQHRPADHADDLGRPVQPTSIDKRSHVRPVRRFHNSYQIEDVSDDRRPARSVSPTAMPSRNMPAYPPYSAQNMYPVHTYDRQVTGPSRQKHSANNAAEAAYMVGMETGRFMPISRNTYETFGPPTIPPGHKSRLGFAGQGIHSDFVNYNDPRNFPNPAFQQTTYTNRPPHISHGRNSSRDLNPPHHEPYQQRHVQRPQTSQTPQHFEPHSIEQQIRPNTGVRPRVLKGDSNNRQPMTLTQLLNDPRPSNPPKEVISSNAPKTTSSNADDDASRSKRPVSLLQKVKMDRENDRKKAEERYEEMVQGIPTTKKQNSETPQAADATAGPASDVKHGNVRIYDVDGDEPEIKPTADNNHATRSTIGDASRIKAAPEDVSESVRKEKT